MRFLTVLVLAVGAGVVNGLGLRLPGSANKMTELSSNIDKKLEQLTQLLDRGEDDAAPLARAPIGANSRFKDLGGRKQQVDTSPLAAESALKNNEGPSDRVSLGHLDVTDEPAQTPAAETIQAQAPQAQAPVAQTPPATRFQEQSALAQAQGSGFSAGRATDRVEMSASPPQRDADPLLGSVTSPVIKRDLQQQPMRRIASEQAPASQPAQSELHRFAQEGSKFAGQDSTQRVPSVPLATFSAAVPEQTHMKAFFPPPIQQAEQERPEDDMSNMYLNPNKDLQNSGNDIWANGDSLARHLSEGQLNDGSSALLGGQNEAGSQQQMAIQQAQQQHMMQQQQHW